MTKKNFKINQIELDSPYSNDYTELDLREELKKRLQLNIIDGELFDRVIECFENNISVFKFFAENRCNGFCGDNYCDENDCVNRKRILTEPFLDGELNK